MPLVSTRSLPARGVVIEVEAGQSIDIRPNDGDPGRRIRLTLEQKSGRHARLRVIADEYEIGRPMKCEA